MRAKLFESLLDSTRPNMNSTLHAACDLKYSHGPHSGHLPIHPITATTNILVRKLSAEEAHNERNRAPLIWDGDPVAPRITM